MIKMCGIAGIISLDSCKVKSQVKHLLSVAKENEHRGKKDGLGIVLADKGKMMKTLFSIDDIQTGKLNDYEVKKEEKETKITKDLKFWNTSILEMESNFMFLHHRKKSVGCIEVKNTHPFEISKNVYYLHNGSISGSELLGRYISVRLGSNLKSTTDTEIIAFIIEDMLKKYGNNYAKLYKDFFEIFYGFGVIIRVDTEKKEVLIFKDWARDLFVHVFKEHLLVTSEPILQTNNHKKLLMFDSGIYQLNSNLNIVSLDGTMIDCTQMEKNFRNHKEELKDVRCDSCSETMKLTKNFEVEIREFYGKKKNKQKKYNIVKRTTVDCCLTCYCNGDLSRHVDEMVSKEDNPKNKRGIWYIKK